MALFIGMSSMVTASAESDGTSNVAFGMKYTVETEVPDSNSYNQDKDTDYMLTDGESSSTTAYSNPQWVKYYRAVSRTVTIDLKDMYAITGINCGFLQNKGAGIYCPQHMVVSVSENGIDFMKVSDIENPVPNDQGAVTRAVYEVDFSDKYKARYIRFYFNVDVNTYADEFQVFGKAVDGSEKEFIATNPKEYYNSYETLDSIDGYQDVMLLYTGYYPENAAVVDNNKAALLPYVGYINVSNKVVDTMFDAFIFTYVGGRSPSEIPNKKDSDPIIGVGTTTSRSIMSDWVYMLDKVFLADYNLDALNAATAQVKSDLSLDANHKSAVYITLPYPKVSEFDFGDYDGDDVVNKLLSVEDCAKAEKWFIEEALQRWDEAGYENLELKGFYWENESISYGRNEDELELVTACVAAVHEFEGMQCIVIPFYQASGIEYYKEIGFDCAFMQPNLSFNETLQDEPLLMMEDFAEACKKFNLAVEMEIHHNLISKGRELGKFYEAYMQACSQNGMMENTPHAYYQGAGPGVIYNCAKSADPYLRYIYDTTYKFIKHTLSFSKDIKGYAEGGEAVAGKNFTGQIGIEGDWYNGDVTFEVVNEPEHGSVRVLNSYEKYYYMSDDDYIGPDTFEVKISYINGYIENFTVNLTVVSEDASQAESIIESTANKDSNSGDLAKTIGIAAAAITGVALLGFAIVKINDSKKRKKNK